MAGNFYGWSNYDTYVVGIPYQLLEEQGQGAFGVKKVRHAPHAPSPFSLSSLACSRAPLGVVPRAGLVLCPFRVMTTRLTLSTFKTRDGATPLLTIMMGSTPRCVMRSVALSFV